MKTNWFTITKLKDNLYAIEEAKHWEHVVSYLVVTKHHAVLFDSGMGYMDITQVVRTITPLPIQLFLTHTHWDHIGGIDAVDSIAVYNDIYEKTLLARGFESKNIPELCDSSLFTPPYQPKEYQVIGKQQVHLLHDQEKIHIDEVLMHVIHTPGHTPGSVCYYLPWQHLLITGDTIYPGGLYAFLPESDEGAYYQSIQTLYGIVPSDTLLLPGHNAISSPYSLLTDIHRDWENIKNGSVAYIVRDTMRIYTFPTWSLKAHI